MTGQERPVVQILGRFHQFLAKLEETLLGELRKAEQSRSVRTITFTPCGYELLKARWRARGFVAYASYYGDTHEAMTVVPVDPEEAVARAAARQVPPHVARLAAAWTGGYPQPFERLIEAWIRRGRPESLNSALRAGLWRTAVHSLERFVEWLAPLDDPGPCNHVIDLAYGINPDRALQELGRHHWNVILLHDQNLRAEGLGEAALEHLSRIVSRSPDERRSTADLPGRCRGLYEQRHYDAVGRLLAHQTEQFLSPDMLALKRCARVMRLLHGDRMEEYLVDADWKQLPEAIEAARSAISAAELTKMEIHKVEDSLQEFAEMARTIAQATETDCRVVDVLGGLRPGRSVPRPRLACLLLLARIEAGNALSGDSRACQFALSLPEQIYRLWAFLRLGLNYYAAPAGHESVWATVQSRFPDVIRRPTPGESFSSFESFSYFALALCLQCPGNGSMPEPDLPALERSLAVLSVRRDTAHAVAVPSRRMREKFFRLIDRWFDALLGACPGNVSRDELREAVRPLPLLMPGGTLRWPSS
jgi:hypothetical protein